jgi:hypothetical protein
MPLDWFSQDNLALLAVYVRVCIESRDTHVAQRKITDAEMKTKDGFKRYKQLVDMHLQLAGRVLNIASKLKLTPASRMTAKAAAVKLKNHTGNGARPWERGN